MCLCLRVCDSTQIYLHASSACVCLLSGLQVYENESRFVEGALWRSKCHMHTHASNTVFSVFVCPTYWGYEAVLTGGTLTCWPGGKHSFILRLLKHTHTNISNWLYRSSYIPNPFLSSFFCACTLVCLSVCCQPVSSYSTDVRPWGLPLLPTMLCYRLTLPRSAKIKKKTELENLFRSFPTAGTRTDTHTDTHGVKEGVICLTLGYTSPMCARVVVSAGVTVSRATLLEKRHLVVHAKYSILCILWICAAVMSAYHADTDLCTFALNLWIILVSKLLFPDYLNHFIWR